MNNSGSMPEKQHISGYNQVSTPNFTPQQMQLLQKLIGSIGGGAEKGLSKLSQIASGEEGAFEELEAPAYAAFNKNLGTLGSRFSQYGAGDSSAFQNAVSGAGAEMAQNLQGQRTQMQMDAIQKLLGFSTDLLGQKPYETSLLQKDKGTDWGEILSKAFGAVPGILTAL
jgi:hypothetical protein